MFIGVLSIELSIPFEETIKERRNIIRSIKDMVRKKFNVSVADVTAGETITSKASLGIAAVSGDQQHLQSVLSNVFNLIETYYSDHIINYQTDIMTYE